MFDPEHVYIGLRLYGLDRIRDNKAIVRIDAGTGIHPPGEMRAVSRKYGKYSLLRMDGEADVKAAALSLLAVYPDFALVGVDDLPAEIQAQA